MPLDSNFFKQNIIPLRYDGVTFACSNGAVAKTGIYRAEPSNFSAPVRGLMGPWSLPRPDITRHSLGLMFSYDLTS